MEGSRNVCFGREVIRPCILNLKEENQEKLKSGEATQRRVAIP
ncbi:hypothetical protein JCM18507_19220 [Fusicatenibacter saccharivorans]